MTISILHVLHSLDQADGGPLRAVLDLSRKAEAYGVRSELIGVGECNIQDNPLGEAQLHSASRDWPHSYAYSRSLGPWLRANLHRFDGIVTHGMWLYPNAVAARECLRARKPYAVFPHGMLGPWAIYRQGKLKFLKKWIYWHLAEKHIKSHAVCSFYTTQRELELAGVPFAIDGMKLVLTPYGVDTRRGVCTGEACPEVRELAGHPFALFLGRLHRGKNPDLLIRAWAEARVPEGWRLVIAGPGPVAFREKLARLAQKLGVARQVVHLGFVAGADKRFLFENAKWFLLPSEHENFGVAVFEAMGYGCPVVTSDQVYLCENFHEDSEVLPLDEKEWVRFFRERMTNESWRRHMIQSDCEKVLPQFDIELIAKGWAETLAQVFGRGADDVRTHTVGG